jgi:hypothetical protein
MESINPNNETIKDAVNLINTLEEVKKEDNAMNEGIGFLLEQWKTNKRWFREEQGRVTTEDVIKTVFQFAWASKRNFDYNKNNPNFNY